MTQNNKQEDRLSDNSEFIEKLAQWHHQRDFNVKGGVNNYLGNFFSNKFTFIDSVYGGLFKNVICSLSPNYKRESALDVVYAYCTSKDDDVKESYTFDIRDLETGDVIGECYKFKDIVQIVEDGFMPVWNLDRYDIYKIDTGVIVDSILCEVLREVYNDYLEANTNI